MAVRASRPVQSSYFGLLFSGTIIFLSTPATVPTFYPYSPMTSGTHRQGLFHFLPFPFFPEASRNICFSPTPDGPCGVASSRSGAADPARAAARVAGVALPACAGTAAAPLWHPGGGTCGRCGPAAVPRRQPRCSALAAVARAPRRHGGAARELHGGGARRRGGPAAAPSGTRGLCVGGAGGRGAGAAGIRGRSGETGEGEEMEKKYGPSRGPEMGFGGGIWVPPYGFE